MGWGWGREGVGVPLQRPGGGPGTLAPSSTDPLPLPPHTSIPFTSRPEVLLQRLGGGPAALAPSPTHAPHFRVHLFHTYAPLTSCPEVLLQRLGGGPAALLSVMHPHLCLFHGSSHRLWGEVCVWEGQGVVSEGE